MSQEGISPRRKRWSRLMLALMRVATAIALGVAAFLTVYVLVRGLPELTWDLLSGAPSYLHGTIGILPDILSTLYIMVATLAIVLPVGIGAAIYLNEYARHPRIVGFIERAAEILSGIPSIIFGLVGMLLFCTALGLRTSLLAGALTLVIMNLPLVIRTTQESLRDVPHGYREGAFALGAGKWRVVRTVVLPECVDGIVTSCILAAGRILGESAALLFTAGFAHVIHGFWDGLLSPGATLSVSMYAYAKERADFATAFAIAALLMLLTLGVNLLAGLAGDWFKKRRKDDSGQES